MQALQEQESGERNRAERNRDLDDDEPLDGAVHARTARRKRGHLANGLGERHPHDEQPPDRHDLGRGSGQHSIRGRRVPVGAHSRGDALEGERGDDGLGLVGRPDVDGLRAREQPAAKILLEAVAVADRHEGGAPGQGYDQQRQRNERDPASQGPGAHGTSR